MTMDSVQTALVSTARFSLLLLLLQCLGNVQTIEAVNNNSTCALCIQPGEVSLRSLYIAFFTSFGGDFLSSGVIPAVDLALELINENTSILQGYSLNYTRIYRIQCERTSSYQNFFDMIGEAPPYPVAALGMGCAVAAEPVAQINSFWNFPMMGYVAAAPTLSDRSRLPSYYRTYPSDIIFVPGIISLIRYYGWKELCLITEEANTFMLNDRMLTRELPIFGVNISEDSFQFSRDDHPASDGTIRNLVVDRTRDPHVFFINTFEDDARAILCEFYQLGIKYPEYLFITHGWYQNRWWSEEVAINVTIPCTDEEMQEALTGNIALQQFPKPLDASAPTDTGLSGDEFDDQYRKRLNTSSYPGLVFQLEAPDAFDATWALALAMDNASKSLCSGDLGHCAGADGMNVSLNCYEFFNSRIECLVNRSLNNLKFEGVSGTVQFDENGTRIQNIVEVFQYRQKNELERVVFAIVNRTMNDTFFYIGNESNNTIWNGQPITPDGIPQMTYSGVHIFLVVLFELLGVAGIVFTIVCLAFNIIFRERKVVKLTSPNLNYFIIAGALLLYLSVILRSLPGFEEIINILRCYVGKVFSSLGYTVAFGAVLVKMWRVYIIFHNPGAKRRTIQDWKLMLIVGSIVSVMAVLLVVNYSIPLFRPAPMQVSDRERPPMINKQNVTELSFVYACGSEDFSARIFQAAVFGYIIILQAIGIVLAFQTRKIKVKVLNDSKWVAAIIYSSSLCVVVIILSEFALVGLLNTSIALLNLAEITATTIFLALVFIPKMVSLYKDPLGENVFSTSVATQQGNNSSVGGDRKLSIFPMGGIDDNSKVVIATLQAKVNELERELKKSNPQNGSLSSSNRNTMTSMDELSVRFEDSIQRS